MCHVLLFAGDILVTYYLKLNENKTLKFSLRWKFLSVYLTSVMRI